MNRQGERNGQDKDRARTMMTRVAYRTKNNVKSSQREFIFPTENELGCQTLKVNYLKC